MRTTYLKKDTFQASPRPQDLDIIGGQIRIPHSRKRTWGPTRQSRGVLRGARKPTEKALPWWDDAECDTRYDNTLRGITFGARCGNANLTLFKLKILR
jgi:hypothetical protein